jgi:hypothetical protein
MDALLRIRTRDVGEVLNNKVDAIVSNGKKQPKGAKVPKVPKAPKVPKVPKVPKGVSSTNKNGEFAKFTPIKAPKNPAPPVPWEDEDADDLESAIVLEDDGKFETENDIFTKQDKEWHELMKEADIVNNDDSSSEVPDDDNSVSEVPDDDNYSETAFEDDGSEMSNIDSEQEDSDVFYSYAPKESKVTPKATRVYSGIPIDFDDSDW